MSDQGSSDDGGLDAGDFATFMSQIGAAVRDETTSNVPCGECTACCTSSQFVHIAPDETDALAHIPAALLFPAPRMPRGHVLLGYDERGRCPMLGDNGCSIYEHRPRTCRAYDCRIFAATGVVPDKPRIAAQTIRWRFTYAGPEDEAAHSELRVNATSGAHDAPSPTALALQAVTTCKPPTPSRSRPDARP
ncbi:MAG TPA: YkgJ family cysteine cluster protein [Ilumatobacteraceae bacterium]